MEGFKLILSHPVPYPLTGSSVVCERVHKFLTIPGSLPLGFKVHICFDFEPTSAWNNLTILVDQAFTSPGQTIPKRFKFGHFLGDDLMFGMCPFLYTDMLYLVLDMKLTIFLNVK